MSATFTCPAKPFVEQIENACLLSTDRVPANDTIMLTWAGGELLAAGCGRYAAGFDLRGCGQGEGEVTLIADLPEAQEFAKAARKLDGFARKGTELEVEMTTEKLVLTHGEEVLEVNRSEMAEEVESTDDFEGVYERLFKFFNSGHRWSPQSLVVTREVLTKLSKLKTGETARPEDEWAFTVVEDFESGNGLTTCRVGPVQVLQMHVEVA